MPLLPCSRLPLAIQQRTLAQLKVGLRSTSYTKSYQVVIALALTSIQDSSHCFRY